MKFHVLTMAFMEFSSKMNQPEIIIRKRNKITIISIYKVLKISVLPYYYVVKCKHENPQYPSVQIWKVWDIGPDNRLGSWKRGSVTPRVRFIDIYWKLIFLLSLRVIAKETSLCTGSRRGLLWANLGWNIRSKRELCVFTAIWLGVTFLSVLLASACLSFWHKS